MKNNSKPGHKTSIGGQALIEGLMMLGPENAAIAIRKADGEIVLENRPLPKKNMLNKIPVLRGVVSFFRQMVMGVKALTYSAEFVDVEEEKDKEPSRFDRFVEKVFGDKFMDVAIYISVVISIAFSVGLFMLLPNLLAGLLPFNKDTRSGVILYNLFEGLLRILIFFGYIILVSRMKDIRRVWEYHGAEHKTIHCYEHGEELTVENVRKYTTKHPRCGTSFLFIVMIVSIIVFSFLGWHNMIINILSRLALIPLVAGLSYEALKFAGRCEWKIVGILNAPGLFLQRFTTREPDDSQIEVGITAFNAVRVDNREADKW